MQAPFNDYDDGGFRVNRHGSKSHKTEDIAIINNVRFMFKEKVEHLSDSALVNAYDDFFWSGMHGDNDARFLEFLADWED